MSDLTPRDFNAYFTEIHGHSPFPWQERLLLQVAKDGRWPELLDLPTGSGKTAAIDVALFHLALEAGRPPGQGCAPRRIVMVVDRRTVVDQAYERARKIALALEAATTEVGRRVRERLCSLSNTDMPLVAAQLRGGMPRDDGWALRPDQPLVAVSTVDQVGSRLLFRGYGVSDGMRPIHAGLLGHDALFLLDEVHLSEPFRQTLDAVQRYRRRSKSGLPDRWQVVPMSATPGADVPRFTLADEDRADPTLARRLRARKPVECCEVRVGGSENACRARFAEECIKHVARYAVAGRTVAVVLNRVASALAVFKLAQERWGTETVHLVTGRMRALDRDDLDRRISSLVSSGRTRDPHAPPVVIVSTQCIEAGADFDFDSLVTECASLDALRQRFGRLNRLGDIEDASGVILARSDSLKREKPDPVYGDALSATWTWLTSAPRDFGIDAMDLVLPTGADLLALLPPRGRAPVMLPSHLDTWVQTNPQPTPDPDVSLWLHGVDQKPDLDVQVVWRADLPWALFDQALGAANALRTLAEEAILARVEACPPTGLEALAVPISAARAWLRRAAHSRRVIRVPEVSDVDGVSTPSEEKAPDDLVELGALLWKGEGSRVILPKELRPGMTIVVPSAYGGVAAGAWDPHSEQDVSDLGDRARFQQTGRPTLRLHPDVMAGAWSSRPVPNLVDEDVGLDPSDVDDWLAAMAASDLPEWIRQVVTMLGKQRSTRRELLLHALPSEGESLGPGYVVLVGRRRSGRGTSEVSSEDDGASHTGVEVTLDDHMLGVKSWAGGFATRCGLPATIVHDVELAARWHDAGKVDPRFQRLLRGGSPLADVASEPLAKSTFLVNDRAVRIRARERSAYPKGARHELSSVSILEQGAELLATANDRDLVLHLVASHHGWCRPFAPAVDDPEPVDLVFDAGGKKLVVSSRHRLAALDSGVPARFWSLVQRYGWFGLAWLEAIVRLADHRRSEEEQSRDVASEGGTEVEE